MRVTVKQARQILEDDSLSDEEIQQIIDDLYQLASIFIEMFLKDKNKKVKNRTKPRQQRKS